MRLLHLGFLGFLVACSLFESKEKSEAAACVVPNWELVWSDEFDYSGLPDPQKWDYDVGGHGWGNREAQYYTRARLENARVENGLLVIEARREAEPYQGHSFTSARLVTRGKASWTYARVEVRAQLPSGRGTWPAIWMLPDRQTYGSAYWPDNGEIDIMEHVGFDPDVVHASIHTQAYNHIQGTQKTARIHVPTARTAFHVYAVEWTPEAIRAFVDDSLYFTFPNERLTRSGADWRQWPFDQPFHLILNIAVGGNWGGMQGIDSTAFPARMLVDYVRVYRCVEGQ
ncbi:glycoside hydrolase family 16 protein [Rhodothermus bifroesti]|uniref:Glycoside hydrolase family 16 protein n=1 Tax=Rhodothermus marinus TaxID=29549 RepID=A0A7V2F6X7_RHOMR|nr:glycoside hydrolase family 16 protein [Rhodothermus bifroesti]GBD01887.1 Beta-glucanase [bacterium HR18]